MSPRERGTGEGRCPAHVGVGGGVSQLAEPLRSWRRAQASRYKGMRVSPLVATIRSMFSLVADSSALNLGFDNYWNSYVVHHITGSNVAKPVMWRLTSGSLHSSCLPRSRAT